MILSPAKAWDAVSASGKTKGVLEEYVFPLIGLCGLSVFLGTFISCEFSSDALQAALTRCCYIAVALYAGYFAAVFLMKKITRKWYELAGTNASMNVFVAYTMTLMFVLCFIDGLYYNVILHSVMQLYTLVIAYEGAKIYLQVKEEQLISYTIWSTLVVSLLPTFIELLLNSLSLTSTL